MRRLFFGLFVFSWFALQSSEMPNFKDLSKSKDAVFFLSTTRSGSNLISSSLSAITRKPISWVQWREGILDPSSEFRNHPSYNRLGLPLVTDQPLMYRTHYAFHKLKKVPSHQNKLIFVTRNPKELIVRQFRITFPQKEEPDHRFITDFLESYLRAFEVYDSWDSENRFIVYYEDFIKQQDSMLLDLLSFMGEEPVYYGDFVMNKEEYLSRILESYQQQHAARSGGLSAIGGPKELFHSKNTNPETLAFIDESIQKMAPVIWEKYLKRFAD